MNQRLPYENEMLRQWDDLSLPDENGAWEDMKRRLETDDDDTLIPPFTKGCLGYSLLFGLLAAIVLLIPYGTRHNSKGQEKITHTSQIQKIKNDTAAYQKTGRPVLHQKYSGSIKINDSTRKVEEDLIKHRMISESKQKSFDPGNGSHNFPKKGRAKINLLRSDKSLRIKISVDVFATDTIRSSKNTKKHELIKDRVYSHGRAQGSLINKENVTGQQDSLTSYERVKDTITKKIYPDTNDIKKQIKEVTDTNKAVKKNSSQKNKFYFGAGLGLQQQLPINGQKLVPYNSLGRKGGLGDYIPSVYVRMYQEKKWFFQSEFRYGAPQYTKEILYVQKKVIDTFTRSTTNTSNRLKKTFYHQLPVSFNYFVLPGFSVGAGLTWNKFVSAIAEQKVQIINNITLDSTVNTTLLQPHKRDSNFAKSYIQAIIETQYQWKRFSAGVKYSFGLQPYLKFQLPGGEQREEKNNSLQLFIKCDLWQSRK